MQGHSWSAPVADIGPLANGSMPRLELASTCAATVDGRTMAPRTQNPEVQQTRDRWRSIDNECLSVGTSLHVTDGNGNVRTPRRHQCRGVSRPANSSPPIARGALDFAASRRQRRGCARHRSRCCETLRFRNNDRQTVESTVSRCETLLRNLTPGATTRALEPVRCQTSPPGRAPTATDSMVKARAAPQPSANRTPLAARSRNAFAGANRAPWSAASRSRSATTVAAPRVST